MLACLALACVIGCATGSEDEATGPAPKRASTPVSIVRSKPTRLLVAPESAYGTTLSSTEDESILLTKSAAYRWTPGEAVSIAHLPERPQRFGSSGGPVAWLERTADGRSEIRTLDGGKPRVVHSAAGYVGTLVVEAGRIYFAERAPDRSWRLGVVPRSGGTAHYGKPKRGRLPAMLVSAESLYYYDGPSSSVLRVAPDLGSEEVLARDVICSPLAVAESIFCAQPAGLIEISLDGGVRRAFPLEEQRSITAVAATATQLTWVSDIGDHQLAIDSIDLTRPEPP